jgi:conjugative transfer pilus assembly protein TraH
LEGIVKKMREDDGDKEITAGEISLINASHLPIYKILNVSLAYQKGRSPVTISQYAELIAFDVAYKYINDVLDAFQDGINRLKSLQMTDQHVQPFMEGMRHARTHLNLLRDSSFAKMDLLLGFIQKTQLIERQLHSMVGSLSNEYGL